MLKKMEACVHGGSSSIWLLWMKTKALHSQGRSKQLVSGFKEEASLARNSYEKIASYQYRR
jgi:hypothetical protein